MTDLYPLLMSPVFDPRPWGTTDLSPIYPSHRFDEKIGESWLTGDNGKVANGPLRGKSLAELSAQYGRHLVGDAAKDLTRFPLLTKFLCKSILMTRPRAALVSRAARPSVGMWPMPGRARRSLLASNRELYAPNLKKQSTNNAPKNC